MRHFALAALTLFLIPSASAEQETSRRQAIEQASQELSPAGPIQLKTIEIRSGIYEPRVIYVLERSVPPAEAEKTQVTFLPRTAEPILDGTL